MVFVKKQKVARTFVAVEIAAGAKREIRKLTEKYEKFHWPVRWEKPEKIHITLIFLGELQQSKLAKLQLSIEKICLGVKPFEISFKGLGAFPDFFRPRIVWVGLKGDLKSLAALQKGIEKELKNAGIWFDKKPFVPHMTIGRVKRGISRGALQDLGKKIAKLRKIDFKSKIFVELVEIMKSELLLEGSVYTKIASIRLGLG